MFFSEMLMFCPYFTIKFLKHEKLFYLAFSGPRKIFHLIFYLSLAVESNIKMQCQRNCILASATLALALTLCLLIAASQHKQSSTGLLLACYEIL